MKNLKLSGCGTALITPFRNGQVDYDTYVKLLDRQIKAGIHFLVPLGTTGETPCLEAEERSRILALTMEHCAGRPVVAGCGTNSLTQTLNGIRQLGKIGPDAYLIVVPYYNISRPWRIRPTKGLSCTMSRDAQEPTLRLKLRLDWLKFPI